MVIRLNWSVQVHDGGKRSEATQPIYLEKFQLQYMFMIFPSGNVLKFYRVFDIWHTQEKTIPIVLHNDKCAACGTTEE